jgi:hypothetical protein
MASNPNPSDKIVRFTGMYGDCRCVKFYRDDEQIGDSTFSICADGPTWFVEILGHEFTLKGDDTDVEAAMRAHVARTDALRFGRAA